MSSDGDSSWRDLTVSSAAVILPFRAPAIHHTFFDSSCKGFLLLHHCLK